MQAAYINALMLRPPVILGRQMQPLSCAHLAALAAIDSPLLGRLQDANAADLIPAIFICSYSWPFPWLDAAQADIEQQVREWGAAAPRFEFREVIAQWSAYTNQYSKAPYRYESPSKAPRVPFPFSLVTFLQCELGIPEARAWNMPLCLVLSYRAAHDAYMGSESVMEEEVAQAEMEMEAEQ